MATATEKEKPKTLNQKLGVQVGDPVVYTYADGSGEPWCAFVTGLGDDTVNVITFADGRARGEAFSGVRHQQDPKLIQFLHNNQTEGCWRFNDRMENLIKANKEVEVVTDRLNSVERTLNGLAKELESLKKRVP